MAGGSYLSDHAHIMPWHALFAENIPSQNPVSLLIINEALPAFARRMRSVRCLGSDDAQIGMSASLVTSLTPVFLVTLVTQCFLM